MATLVSPGVDIQITDESFYTSSGAGTVPLIVLATASNKLNPSGSTAPYTLPSQAGSLFMANSQRELIENFGVPTFKTVQGTAVHGSELNEYGLQAAYSFLGISNRAYVLRADIDLAQLESSSTKPVSNPASGTYWFDLSSTSFGVFQSNGNNNAGLAWVSQPVLYAAASSVVTVGSTDVPSPTFGDDGDFAIVVTLSDNLLYEKISGDWYAVGTNAWKQQRPTVIVGASNPTSISPSDTIIINNVTVDFSATTGTLNEVITAINNANISNIVASLSSSTALVITNTAGGDITINNGSGTPLNTLGLTVGTKSGVTFNMTSDAQYPSGTSAGSVWIKGTSPNKGASWSVKYFNGNTSSWVSVSAPFYPYNSTLNDGNVTKDQAATTAFGTPTTGTLYVGYDVSNGTQQLRRWNGLIWENLAYEAGIVPPTADAVEGTYWFNSDLRVDIMYGDGTKWVGYKNKFPDTDPSGVIISGSRPITQTDGTALVDNDLWIDSSDLENYPKIYRYDTSTVTWSLIDKTDQTSPFGIVFADARQNTGTNYTGNPNAGNYTYNSETISEMLKSNFVDPDAPNPTAYPDGMLLFNTRYSTYNVKEWKPNYFKADGYSTTDYTANTYTKGSSGALFPTLTSAGRWVSASGNDTTGVPYMGRKSQRVIVVRAMASAIANNDDIRSEIVYYNLIAAPGYPELIDEMVTLNTEQKEVAFVIGDTPARLKPNSTDFLAWASNKNSAPSNGEVGLTSSNAYVGVYYPWGLANDLNGNEIMVPPSQIALNTIAYNDSVSYQWYAPAGPRRGIVSNASTVGYLSSEGEFVPVILNQGQRDTIYSLKVNPIAYVPNRGLVVYGQKTLYSQTSALDRINVARLMNYIKFNLDNLVKSFLFEQNDVDTRASAQATVEKFFNGIVGLKGIYDYVVVCDATNNYGSRIDRNELWIDVAIRPAKTVEFIYVPIRILNTASDETTI